MRCEQSREPSHDAQASTDPREQLEQLIARTPRLPIFVPLGRSQAAARKHARAIVRVHALLVDAGLVPSIDYATPHDGLVARGWIPRRDGRWYARPSRGISCAPIDEVAALRSALLTDVRAALRSRGWVACPTRNGGLRYLTNAGANALAQAAMIELGLLTRPENGVRA